MSLTFVPYSPSTPLRKKRNTYLQHSRAARAEHTELTPAQNENGAPTLDNHNLIAMAVVSSASTDGSMEVDVTFTSNTSPETSPLSAHLPSRKRTIQ